MTTVTNVSAFSARVRMIQNSTLTPVVGMLVKVYARGPSGNVSVTGTGTIIYVTASKKRIHIQSEGHLKMFSLRTDWWWLPVGAPMQTQPDCWLELEYP